MTLYNNFLLKRGVGLFSRVGLFSGDYGTIYIMFSLIIFTATDSENDIIRLSVAPSPWLPSKYLQVDAAVLVGYNCYKWY